MVPLRAADGAWSKFDEVLVLAKILHRLRNKVAADFPSRPIDWQMDPP